MTGIGLIIIFPFVTYMFGNVLYPFTTTVRLLGEQSIEQLHPC